MRNRRNRWSGRGRWKGWLCGFLVMLLTAGLYGGLPAETVQGAAGDMAVHFLDVGQGLSILVQSGGQNLLYDGGDRSASSFVVSYLREQQVSTIDYLIASHYDEDHLSGLIGCLSAYSVNTVIGPDYDHDSALYTSFLDVVKEKGLSVEHPSVGTEYAFGTGAFTILAPEEIRENDSNDNSVVIRLTNGENAFLFTGDAEYTSEARMVDGGLELSCDVLSVGHHGSASSTSWDFLAATVPEYAVISCGEGNVYGHPDEETLEKLEAMEIPLFRTDKQGTVIGVSNGDEITWNVSPWEAPSGGGFDTGAVYSQEEAPQIPKEEVEEEQVWLSATGSKYHSIPDCGNMDPTRARQIPLSDAQAQGYEACKKCY